jgi:hypothetical protein
VFYSGFACRGIAVDWPAPLLMSPDCGCCRSYTFYLSTRHQLLFIAGGLIAGRAGIFASASWALATDIVPKDEGALYSAWQHGHRARQHRRALTGR